MENIRDVFIKLQKEFRELYDETCLVGLGFDYVLLESEGFSELFPVGFEKRERDDDSYPFELTTKYKGVEFIALVAKEEFEDVDLHGV